MNDITRLKIFFIINILKPILSTVLLGFIIGFFWGITSHCFNKNIVKNVQGYKIDTLDISTTKKDTTYFIQLHLIK